MATIRFAYVRYLEDDVKTCVPIEHVKKYYPKNDTDFVKNKIYKVLWASQSNSEDVNVCEEDNYYKANILLLGGE